MVQVKKVPESRRALGTSQAQALACLQKTFAVTGLLFISFEPDAVTFLDAALKSFVWSWPRAFGRRKPEAKRV